MSYLAIPLILPLAVAFIYIDPGSGSFLLQLLIAGLAGLGIALGTQWRRLVSWFRKKKNRGEERETKKDEEDD